MLVTLTYVLKVVFLTQPGEDEGKKVPAADYESLCPELSLHLFLFPFADVLGRSNLKMEETRVKKISEEKIERWGNTTN